MKYIAYSNVLTKSAQNGVSVAVVLAGLRTIAVVTGTAVVAAAVAILNFLWLVRRLSIDLRTNLATVWRLCRGTFIFWVGTVFAGIYLWIDTIMLSLMTDTHVVGWYGTTTTLFQTLLAVPGLVSAAWLPQYVTAFGRSPEDLKEVARKPVEMVLAFSLTLAAGTAMFAHVIVVGFYGAAFSRAVPVMVALAVCMIPMHVNMMLGPVATASGRQRIWMWLMVLAVVVNSGLNLILIPLTQHHFHNGAIGAGWAMVVTEVIQGGIAFALVGVPILNRGSYLRFLGAGLASGLMLGVHFVANPLGTPIALGLGVLALPFGLLAFRAVKVEELMVARGFVSTRLGRRFGRKARPAAV